MQNNIQIIVIFVGSINDKGITNNLIHIDINGVYWLDVLTCLYYDQFIDIINFALNLYYYFEEKIIILESGE